MEVHQYTYSVETASLLLNGHAEPRHAVFCPENWQFWRHKNLETYKKNRQCSVVATSKQILQFGDSACPNLKSLFLDHNVLFINSICRLLRLSGIFSFRTRLKLLMEISRSKVSTPSLPLVRRPGGGS